MNRNTGDRIRMAAFAQGRPYLPVFAYIAPISMLIHLCGREPEKTAKAMQRIEAFNRLFLNNCKATGKE